MKVKTHYISSVMGIKKVSNTKCNLCAHSR